MILLPQLSPRAWRLCAALSLSLLLGACATPARQAYVATTLSPAQRLQAYEEVVKTIAENYVNPGLNGVDWPAVTARYRPQVLAAADDAAFWRALDHMVGELKDAHTRVYSPEAVNALPWQRGSFGLQLERVEGQLVLQRVSSASQAHLLGARAGQRVLAVDEQAAADWLAAQLAQVRGSSTERSAMILVSRALNSRAMGSHLSLRLQGPDGPPFTVSLQQQPATPPGLRVHQLDNGLAYVQLSVFNPLLWTDLEYAFKRLDKAKGLVLDLRGNGGGSLTTAIKLLSWLLPPGKVGEVQTRDNKRLTALLGLLDVTPKLELTAQAGRLTQPLAVLVDDSSASASELTAAVLQSQGRARVFGRTSCGCLLGVRGSGTSLAGGGRLSFSEVDMLIGPSAIRLEGVGVLPDEVLPLTLQSLQGREDRDLAAAWAWLAAQPEAKPAAAAAAAPSAAKPAVEPAKAGR